MARARTEAELRAVAKEAALVRNRFNQSPEDPVVMLDAASRLYELNHFAVAHHILSRIPKPDDKTRLLSGMAHIQLAATTGNLRWLDQACGTFQSMAADFPQMATAHLYLAIAYLDGGALGPARDHLTRSLELDPAQDGEAPFTLAQLELLEGHWPEGWAALERFHRARESEFPYRTTERERVLVRGKGGIGDEIMLASLIPDLRRDGIDFTLICEPRLMGLFERSFPGCNFKPRDEAEHRPIVVWNAGAADPVQSQPAYSCECFMASFGSIYRPSRESFPRTPYLVPDPQLRLAAREVLAALPGKKVGIAWAGGPALNWARRSLTLAELVPLMRDMPGVSWVTLEYLDPSASITELAKQGITVHEIPGATRAGVDYDATASFICELDAIVGVNTAVMHLAGAMGLRAHVMVPQVPRWWWSLEGSQSAWYGSLALHRQGPDGRWPIEAVRAALLEDLGGAA